MFENCDKCLMSFLGETMCCFNIRDRNDYTETILGISSNNKGNDVIGQREDFAVLYTCRNVLIDLTYK